MVSKVCNTCKLEKDLEEYPKRKERKSGYYGSCKPCYYARKKRSREANPKHYKEYHQKWRDENRDKVSAAQEKYYYKNHQKKLDYKRQWDRDNPEAKLLRDAKHRAKKNGIEFNIELSDITIPGSCPVLGIKIGHGYGVKKTAISSSPTLDRIDNTKGYVKGNVAVISYKANRLKGDATIDEVKSILKYMQDHEEE